MKLRYISLPSKKLNNQDGLNVLKLMGVILLMPGIMFAMGSTIRGRIIDGAGRPLVNKRVVLNLGNEEYKSVYSNKQGNYTFSDVLPGNYRISFEEGVFTFRVLVTDEDTDINLESEVVKKQYTEQEVSKMFAQANAKESLDDLVLTLVASYIDESETPAFKKLFELGDVYIESITKLLENNFTRPGAAKIIAYLGDRRGIEKIKELIHKEGDIERRNYLIGVTSAALVEPESDEEWKILADALKLPDTGQGPGSIPAILALGINGSPKAIELLTNRSKRSQDMGSELIKIFFATRQKRSTKLSFNLSEEEEAIRNSILRDVFFVKEQSFSVKLIQFNSKRNKVLTEVEMKSGPLRTARLDIVLEKVGKEWRILSAWFKSIA